MNTRHTSLLQLKINCASIIHTLKIRACVILLLIILYRSNCHCHNIPDILGNRLSGSKSESGKHTNKYGALTSGAYLASLIMNKKSYIAIQRMVIESTDRPLRNPQSLNGLHKILCAEFR